MDDIVQQCREYVDSAGRTPQPRMFEVAREVVRLADELAARAEAAQPAKEATLPPVKLLTESEQAAWHNGHAEGYAAGRAEAAQPAEPVTLTWHWYSDEEGELKSDLMHPLFGGMQEGQEVPLYTTPPNRPTHAPHQWIGSIPPEETDEEFAAQIESMSERPAAVPNLPTQAQIMRLADEYAESVLQRMSTRSVAAITCRAALQSAIAALPKE